MFTCKSNALFPKYRPDPELDSSDRCIEYRKQNGEVRDIYTNTKTYPPQYFIAKSDQKETPPLPTCSDDRKKVHDELKKAVDEKDRNSFKYYIDRCEYGSNDVLMTAIGPLISQYFTKRNISKERNDLHKELVEKVKNKNNNWADRYQESLQDNQRLKKKLGKWMRKAQEFKDKYEELKEEYDRISMYRIR